MSQIDAGEPTATEVVAERMDAWQVAYGWLQARFETFTPGDVLDLIDFMQGED